MKAQMKRAARLAPEAARETAEHNTNTTPPCPICAALGHATLEAIEWEAATLGDLVVLAGVAEGLAVQGGGEVALSAVETSLKGEIQVILHKGMHLNGPRGETPTHYMTMGLDEDLNVAAKIATLEMLNFVVETKGLSRDDAYMLLSANMDLIVTEAVDGVKGIHALLPKAIFQK